jgi:hypothetical protein
MASKPRERGRFACPGAGESGERTPGSGIGASSTLAGGVRVEQVGPNSSPNQRLPALSRRNDSGSKSPPVSGRSAVFSLTIGTEPLIRIVEGDPVPHADRALRPRARDTRAAGRNASSPSRRSRCPRARRTSRYRGPQEGGEAAHRLTRTGSRLRIRVADGGERRRRRRCWRRAATAIRAMGRPARRNRPGRARGPPKLSRRVNAPRANLRPALAAGQGRAVQS